MALTLWPNGEVSKFVAMGSALYVISRGAGNVADAIKREIISDRFAFEVGGRNVLVGQNTQA